MYKNIFKVNRIIILRTIMIVIICWIKSNVIFCQTPELAYYVYDLKILVNGECTLTSATLINGTTKIPIGAYGTTGTKGIVGSKDNFFEFAGISEGKPITNTCGFDGYSPWDNTYNTGTCGCTYIAQCKVDNPVVLSSDSTSYFYKNTFTINYAKYYNNGYTPQLQYCVGTGNWINSPQTFTPAGGSFTFNVSSLLAYNNMFTTSVQFRVVKKLLDNTTYAYGNILSLSFYDKQILTLNPVTGLACEDGSIEFTRSLTNFPGQPFMSGIEAKFINDLSSTWYHVWPFSPLTVSMINSAIGQDCRGKEVQIRAFNSTSDGKEWHSVPKSVVFLPTPSMVMTPHQPSCVGVFDASFDLWFSNVPNSGCVSPGGGNVPVLINISKYDLDRIATEGFDYIKTSFPPDLRPYYYSKGITLQKTIDQSSTGSSITIDNSKISDPNLHLGAGKYIIKAQINSGSASCPFTQTFDILEPTPVVINKITPALLGCGYNIAKKSGTGSITVDVSGGTGTYEYSYNNEVTYTVLDNSKIISNIPAGSYTLNIRVFKTGTDHCSTVSKTFTLTEPTAIIITPSIEKNVSCLPGQGPVDDGSFHFTVTGGVQPYNTSVTGYTVINNSNYYRVSSLKSGNYTINVTDKCSATYSNSNMTITNPTKAVTANFTSGIIVCNGGTTTIDASAGGGTELYQFSLDKTNWYPITPSSTSKYSFSNKISGDYNIYVHDDNGCLATSAKTFIDQPLDITAPTLLSSITDATCATASNGIVSINPTGGTKFTDGYDILINGIDTKNTRTLNYSNINLPVGKYSVSIIDSKGCSPSVTPSVTIGVGANPLSIANVSVVNAASCSMVSDGSASVTLNPGSRPFPNYSYYVNNILQGTATASVNSSINGLSSTIQTFKAIDNAGCVATYNQSIGVINNSLSLLANNSVDAHCKDNPGSITLNRNNGTTNFNYTVLNEDGSTYSNFTNSLNSFSVDLPFGLYNFKVKDNNNCEAVSSGEIIVSPKHLDLNEPLTASSVCEGSPTGKISVSKIAGTGFMPDVKYFLNTVTPSDNGVFNNLIPGNYTLSAIDNENCISPLKIVSVGYNTNPVSISSELIDQSCANINNGRIIVNSTSTQNGKNFNIVKIKILNLNDSILNSNTDTFKLLPAGTYHIFALDENRCSTIKDIVINNGHFSPKPLLDNTTEVACKNATNGTLTVFGSKNKSVPTYKYILDGNNSKALAVSDTTVRITFKDLQRGLHNITVIDNIGCQDSSKFLVGIHADSVRLNPVSAIPATCILAKNGYATIMAKSFDHSINSKKYKFTCNGENIWGESAVFTNLGVNKTGWTNVTVSDTFGCIDANHFVVNVQPDTLKLAFDNIINAACPGSHDGHIKLLRTNGNNGFKYNITKDINQKDSVFYENNTNIDVTKLTFGNYKISVQDTFGCKASLINLSINQPDTIKFYSFTNNYIKHKGLPEGVITTKLQSGNNKYVYEWQNLKDNSTIQTGKAHVNSGISITNLPAGDYLFKAQDTAQCFVAPTGWLEKKFHIAEPDSNLKIYLTQNNPVTCFGLTNGEVKVKATGGWGSEYTYGKDATNLYQSDLFDNLKANDYIFYAKDTSGVMISLPVTVIQPDILTSDIKSFTDANCYGSSDGIVKTTIHGGNFPFYYISADKIHWNKGDSLNTLSKGTYLISIRDTFGCSYDIKTPIIINQPTQISAIDTVIQKSKCGYANGTITANFSGGIPAYSYEWHNETGDLLAGNKNNEQNLFSGTYFLKVTDTHNCPYQFHYNVSDITDLTIDRIDTTNVSCWGYSNGGAKISVSRGNPPYSILWPDKSTNTSVSGLNSGSYIVRVDDQEKCKLFKDFYIGTPDSIGIESTTRTNPLCEGRSDGSIGITPVGGFGNYQYQWENGKKTNPLLNLIAGKYTVLVTDGHKCFNTFTYNLQYQQTINPSLGNDINLCLGNKYTLSPGTYSDYKWTSNVGITSADSTLTVSQQGKYYVEVKDNDGCIGRDSVTFGQSQTNLTGKLLVASNVQVKDTVMIFEASWPLPDSVLFHLPGCNIISSGKYFREVIYSDTGKFAINLTSYLNDCLDYITKDIQVEPRGNNNNIKSVSSRLIQSYAVSPNPSDGHINVEIHLRESAPIIMKLANLGTGITNNVRELKGSDIYLTSYNFSNLPPGIYILYIQAGNETQTKTLIIQK